jgi:SecD/SecF fusion protein
MDIPREQIKLETAGNQLSLTISRIDPGRIDQIRNMITGQARLEFWETYENKEIIDALTAANKISKATQTETLFEILSPRVSLQGDPLPSSMIGVASGKDTSDIDRYLKLSQVKSLFPPDIRFFWSQKTYKYDTSDSLYELHAIKVTTADGQAPLNGSVITSANVIEGPGSSDVKIDLTMNDEGAGRWAAMTRENINRCIAVVLNGRVRSYPRVMNEISGGKTEITGDFTLTEARDLINLLSSGAMPCELKIVDEQIIKRE